VIEAQLLYLETAGTSNTVGVPLVVIERFCDLIEVKY